MTTMNFDFKPELIVFLAFLTLSQPLSPLMQKWRHAGQICKRNATETSFVPFWQLISSAWIKNVVSTHTNVAVIAGAAGWRATPISEALCTVRRDCCLRYQPPQYWFPACESNPSSSLVRSSSGGRQGFIKWQARFKPHLHIAWMECVRMRRRAE